MKRPGGHMMVEIMMALALLACVTLAVIGVTPQSLALQHNSSDAAAQLYSAQQKLDAILACNVFIGPSWTSDTPLPGVTRRWRAIPDPYGRPGVEIVEVEVDWRQGARPRSIVLHGMVAP